MILLGQRASTLVTARGDYPIPLTPVGNRGDCIEQLERARQRREARAYPILNPGPVVQVKPPSPKAARQPRPAARWRPMERPTRPARNILFPDDAAQQLRRDYEAGATVRTIAERHECSRDTVAKAIRRVGGVLRTFDPPRPVSPTPDQVAAFVAAYEHGATFKALGRESGFHPRTVRDHIRAAGVTERPPLDLPPDEQAQRRANVVADYLAGHPVAAIATKHGITRRTVRRNVIAAGHPVRGQQAEGMWA